MAKAIVEATLHYNNPEKLAGISEGLGNAMRGLDIAQLSATERLQERGV